MALDSASLERIVPELLECDGATGGATLALHLARYRFALEHLQPGTLLDIACGVGYGTDLLAAGNTGIVAATGVDISADAIQYARAHYGGPRTRFVESDALTFWDPNGYENIVSLETIEHIPNPRAFLRYLFGLLKPGGVLIGSVPVTPSVDANPYHLTDFTERSFRTVGRELRLIEIACLFQAQPYDPIAILRGQEKRSNGIRRNLAGYYLAHPRKLLARIWSIARHGFQNRYLTVVWRSPQDGPA
jgi:SAM-dependent methyltransferase